MITRPTCGSMQRSRKLAETPVEETVARDFIAWAVQHYAADEFRCELHLWHLANRAGCVSAKDLKRIESLRKDSSAMPSA